MKVRQLIAFLWTAFVIGGAVFQLGNPIPQNKPGEVYDYRLIVGLFSVLMPYLVCIGIDVFEENRSEDER